MLAAMRKQPERVLQLVREGASLVDKNKEGRTALSIISEHLHYQFVGQVLQLCRVKKELFDEIVDGAPQHYSWPMVSCLREKMALDPLHSVWFDDRRKIKLFLKALRVNDIQMAERLVEEIGDLDDLYMRNEKKPVLVLAYEKNFSAAVQNRLQKKSFLFAQKNEQGVSALQLLLRTERWCTYGAGDAFQEFVRRLGLVSVSQGDELSTLRNSCRGDSRIFLDYLMGDMQAIGWALSRKPSAEKLATLDTVAALLGERAASEIAVKAGLFTINADHYRRNVFPLIIPDRPKKVSVTELSKLCKRYAPDLTQEVLSGLLQYEDKVPIQYAHEVTPAP